MNKSAIWVVTKQTEEPAILCDQKKSFNFRDTNIVYNNIFDINRKTAVIGLFSTLLHRREDAEVLDIGPSNCLGIPGQSIGQTICQLCDLEDYIYILYVYI